MPTPASPPPIAAPTREGGYNALVGYLYQFLGSGACLAEVLKPVENTNDGGFGTSIYFEVEQFGQDAVNTHVGGTGTKVRKFIQFKFSLNPDAHPIQPAELFEISETFRASERAANAVAIMPSEFLLRTNRPLSPESKTAKDAAEKGLPNSTLDTKVTPPKSKTKTPRKEEPHEPHFRTMVRELRYDRASFESEVEKLEEYARTFGVNQRLEREEGVNRVIALILRKATSPPPRRITPAQLAKELSGIDHPMSLVAQSLAPRLLNELNRQRHAQLGIEPADIIETREAIEELTTLTNEAMVVFWGDGGCGKSSLMMQIFKDVLSQSSRSKALAAAIIAREPVAKSLGELIGSWRTQGVVPNAIKADTPDAALSRVTDANRTATPPILMLGLDGVDELTPNMPHPKIDEAIRYFWDMHQRSAGVPAARLFITCRTKKDIGRFIDPGGFEATGKPPLYVRIDDFSDGEFENLCRRILPADVAAGLISSGVSAGTPNSSSDQPISDGPRPRSPLSVTPATIETLHHPTIWRFFTRLTPEGRIAFLRGDPAAAAEVWNDYIRWFCKKAEIRNMMNQTESRLMLIAAAKHCPDGDDTYRLQNDWVVPLFHELQCIQAQALKFYAEALAAGVIVEAPGRPASPYEPESWMWRNPQFWEHLRTL